MKKLVTLLILFSCISVFGQVITSYNFGSAVTAVSTFNFTSSQVKTAGTDDWTITTSTASATTQYGGASGSASVTTDNTHNTTSITKTLTTPAISTSSKYNIIVSWAERKTSTFTAPVVLEYSSNNGTDWTSVSYIDNEDYFISSLGTQTFYSVNHARLPSAADNVSQLKLRWSFATQGNSGTIRFDDIYICAYNKTWTGSAGDNSWGSASNWSGSAVPTSTDYVLLDNTNVSGNYYVDCASTATIGALAVYGGSNTITLNYKTGAAITANNNTLADVILMQGAYVKCFISSASAMLYATSASLEAGYGSTIEYNYSGTETLKDGNYGSIIVSGTGTKTWTTGNMRRLTGNLNISSSSGTLSIGSGNAVAGYGDVTVASGSTLSFGSGAGRIVNSAAGKSFTLNGVVRITATTSQSTTAFSFQCNGFTTYSFGSSSWISFRNASSTAATQGIDGISGTPFANVELAGITNLSSAGTNTFNINTNLEITGTLAFPRITGATNTSLAINFNSYTVKVGGAIQLDGTNASGIAGGRTYTAGTSTIELNGSSAQTIGGTDLPQTFNNLNVNNTAGVTMNSAITVNGTVQMLNGSLSAGSYALTYGASGTLKYAGSSQQTSANGEFPSSSGPFNLTIANSAGVVLHAARSIGGTLTLTSGNLTTTAANVLTLTGTSAGLISGASASSYVNGPLDRTLPASLSAGSTYTFPVGKGSYNPFELVSPTTTSGGTVVVRVEAFDANCGGSAGTNLSNLATNRYWQAGFTSGAANFTNTKVKITESGLSSASGIGQSSSLTGAYNSLGGTFTGTNVVSFNTTTTLDYFAFGQKTDMQPLAANTYSVGASGKDYTNISAVIDALNSKILTGNVIFELASDYSSSGETFPLTFYPFADGGNGYTATIRPASGVTATIANSGSTSPVIDLSSVKNLFFDGRDGGTGTNKNLTITNGATSSATGGPAVRFINDANNTTLRYLNLNSSYSNSAAPGTGVVLFSTGISSGNDNNTIEYCNINGNGSYGRGVYSLGSSQSIDNNNNTISNCSIYDWYNNEAATTYNTGIYLDSYNSAWTLNNNSIYQTTSRNPANGCTYYGIFINSSTGSNFTVNSNYIGGNGANGGSGNLTIGNSVDSRFWGIYLQSIGNSTASNIQGNTISKVALTVTPGSGVGVLYGISVGTGSVNIGTTADNIIGSASATDALTVNFTASTGSTYFDGIRLSNVSSSDVVNIGSSSFKNIIGGFTASGTTTGTFNMTGIRYGTTASATNYTITNNRIGEGVSNSLQAGANVICVMSGILNNTAGTGNVTISNNVISNFTNSNTSATAVVKGINTPYNSNTITGNTVSNLSTASANITSGSGGAVLGIIANSTTGNQTVNNNTIYSLYSTRSAATTIYVYGIFFNGPTSGTHSVSQNKVYDLTTDNGNTGATTIRGILFNAGSGFTCANNIVALGAGITTSPTLSGIEQAGADGDFYFNTVKISGAPTSGSSSSFAFRRTSTNINTVKNNVFINERTNNGSTGPNVAYRTFSLTTLTSDYNNLYVTDGTYGSVGMLNTTGSTTLTDWRTASSLESHSVSATAPFISATDLHVDNTQSSCWNLKGKGTPVSSISTDYDGNTRVTSGNQGVDIGADEFTAPAVSTSGAIEDAGSTTFTASGYSLGNIAWHKGTESTLPTSVQMNYYPGTTPPGSASGDKSNCYWIVTPTGGTTGNTYDITLHYDESLLNGIPEANIRPAKSDDGGNTYVTYTDAAPGRLTYALDQDNNTVTIYGLSSFSQFTLSSSTNPLPIELSSFNSIVKGRDVQLVWETKSELNSAAFVIEKAKVQEQGSLLSWNKTGEVKASGNSNSPLKYSFRDIRLSSGSFKYRLKMVDNDGSFKYSQVLDVEISKPTEYGLNQNYPNPFNPSTVIEYQLPVDGKVVLELYSITGQKVSELVNAPQSAGFYSYPLNAGDFRLSSGIYLYRLSVTGSENSGKFTQIKKMIFLK